MVWSDVPCKLWTGGTVRGYGQTTRTVNGVSTAWLVHRLAWVEAHGPIPPETPHVLHHCDTPSCYEVAHLWLGTHQDNMLDCAAKGRNAWAKKTHCPAGHPYDEENTFLNPTTGSRQCRTCTRAQKRAYKERQKAKDQA